MRYVANKELPGLCFNLVGAAVPYFPYEQLPLYPGGQLRLTQEISQLMSHQCPSELSFLIAGWYDINFLVEDGSIDAPKVTVDGKKALLIHSLPDITSKDALAAVVESERNILICNALSALAKLSMRFCPSKRDGAVVRWQYHSRILFDYEVGRPRRRAYADAR